VRGEGIRDFLNRNRLPVLLGLFVFLVYGYFYGGCGANQNSRLNAVYAFVEPGTPEFLTFRVDRFILDAEKGINTGDWSFANGHYYSNKAPGTIFLGIPFYFVLFHSEKLLGLDPFHPDLQILNAYFINLFVSVFFCALAAAVFFKLALCLTRDEKDSLLLFVTFAFATLLFPFCTQIWGHPTSAAFVVFSLFAVVKGSRKALFFSGLWIGMAAVIDYLTALFVISMGIIVFVKYRRKIIWYALGGIFPLALFGLYHRLCFGSFFVLATDFMNPKFVDRDKIAGVFGGFSLSRTGQMLFSTYRGIFLFMPVLLLSTVGVIYAVKKRKRDPMVWVNMGSVVLYLLIVSGFSFWDAGRSLGPRYLIPLLPFLVLVLKDVPKRKVLRTLLLVLLGFSVFNMLVISSVSPLCHHDVGNPLYGFAYGMFFSGKFSPYGFLYPRLLRWQLKERALFLPAAWNAGNLMGLDGLYSLLPLLLFSSAAGILLYTKTRKRFFC
jgi:hypothetical protein